MDFFKTVTVFGRGSVDTAVTQVPEDRTDLIPSPAKASSTTPSMASPLTTTSSDGSGLPTLAPSPDGNISAGSTLLTSGVIAGIVIGSLVIAALIGMLAYYYGYRRIRAKRLAAMGAHRLSISCQGISTPIHLSSGKIVTPTTDLSPAGSLEHKEARSARSQHNDHTEV